MAGRGERGRRHLDLAPDRSHELARSQRDTTDQLPQVRKRRPKLRVADVDGQERVLEARERAVRVSNRLDRVLDEDLRANRCQTGRGWLELAACQAVAGGELRVDSPCPAVGQLNRPKEPLFELVLVGFVELLVGRAERRKRHTDRVRGLGDGVAELWWDSLEDLVAGYSSEMGQAASAELLEDERRFIDLPRSPLWLGEENVVVGV